MRPGERYNPWKLFHGIFIPNWLAQRPEVSQGAKVCFGRLGQYAGQDGECFPNIDTLAAEIGVSRRQADTYLSELRRHRLIAVRRSGLGKTNRYCFLWHQWAENEAPKERKRKRGTAHLDAKNTAHQDTQDTAQLDAQDPACPNGREPVKRRGRPAAKDSRQETRHAPDGGGEAAAAAPRTMPAATPTCPPANRTPVLTEVRPGDALASSRAPVHSPSVGETREAVRKRMQEDGYSERAIEVYLDAQDTAGRWVSLAGSGR